MKPLYVFENKWHRRCVRLYGAMLFYVIMQGIQPLDRGDRNIIFGTVLMMLVAFGLLMNYFTAVKGENEEANAQNGC